MRRNIGYLILIVGTASAAWLPSHAADAEAFPTVKISVVKTFTRTITPAQFQVMATSFNTVLKAQARLNGELLSGGGPEEIGRQLVDGSIHFGVVHGIEFGWMKNKQPDLVPVMLNILNPEWLQPVVVVAKDSSAKSLADCRGQKLAVIKSNRLETRLFFDRLCSLNQSRLEDMFPNAALPLNVEDALDDLVDGDFEVVVLEQSGLSMYQRRKPGRASKLRILEQSDPFPTTAIVYRKSAISDDMIKTFRDGLSTAHNSVLGSHLLALMKIRRFELPTDEYHKHLAGVVKMYPAGESTNVVNTTIGNASK